MSRVLVVEDNAAIRELVGMYLKQAGHAVALAENGDDALAAVTSRGSPDVAVLDVEMPGMNGLQLLTRLRELPGMGGLPAIFLSARVQPQDILAGTDMGASYLTKPFIGSALVNLIGRVLRPAEEEW
jgi:DNA-binding response OmpR family regulator